MAIIKNLYSRLKNIQNTLLPGHCVLCGVHTGSGLLCPPCRDDLPWSQRPCPRCGGPLPPGSDGPCGACLKRPPPFATTFTPFVYAEPLDRLLLEMKFSARFYLIPLLAGLMEATHRARGLPLPQALVPVPLHGRRLRERGFNQSALLARELGRRLGLPVLDGACLRRRSTIAQARLDAHARRRNLRGAFVCSGLAGYTHLAVVDDVITTGTTVGELTTALLRSGAERIEAWALARAGESR